MSAGGADSSSPGVAAAPAPGVAGPPSPEKAGPSVLEAKKEKPSNEVDGTLDVVEPAVGAVEAVNAPMVCKCQQCQRQVPIDACAVTNKNRLSGKVSPIYRCKWCNRVQVVLYREMADDLQLKSLHQAMSSTDKKEWLALHHDQFESCAVDTIKKSMEKFVIAKSTISTSITGESTFNTNYRWLDETDLKEEFKQKPEVIANTLKHAKTLVCDVTKRKFYGLPVYESNTSEKAITQVGHQVEAITQAHQAPAKKPRIAMISFSALFWIGLKTICFVFDWFEKSALFLDWLEKCSLFWIGLKNLLYFFNCKCPAGPRSRRLRRSRWPTSLRDDSSTRGRKSWLAAFMRISLNPWLAWKILSKKLKVARTTRSFHLRFCPSVASPSCR